MTPGPAAPGPLTGRSTAITQPPPPPWGEPGEPPTWGAPDAGPDAGPAPVWGAPGSTQPDASPGRGTGLVPLRPLTVGEIYDGAIRAIRGNPRTMAGFAAVVVAVLSLLTLLPQALALTQLATSGVLDPGFSESATWSDVVDAAGSTTLTLALAVIEYVLGTALVSSLLVVAVDAAVRGRTLGPGELLRRTRRRIPAVIGLAVVIILSAPLVLLVCLLPGIVVSLAASSLDGLAAGLLVIGLIVGLPAAAALIIGYLAVASPVLLLENTGIRTALRRSRQLVRGDFWRVFGIGVLTGIIVAVIRQIFLVPFSLAANVAGPPTGTGSFAQTVVQLLILNAGSIVAGAIFLPFSGGVSALLYLDLRIRREGLDVELLRPDPS